MPLGARFKSKRDLRLLSMKAVLFDLGHTLIDYHNDWREPERRAVESVAAMVLERCTNGVRKEDVSTYLLELLEQGRRKKSTEFVEIPLESVLNDCFQRFLVEHDEDLIEIGLEAFYGVLQERRKIVPGTVEMLEMVQDQRFSIGLVSDVAWGLPSYFPLKDIRYYGLEGFFDDMVFSTDVGLRKPNPRIFKIALFNIGATAEETIFVGNNLQADIKGALDVGMRTVLKKSDFYIHDNSIVPTFKIDNWPDFEDILRRI